jgi:hypothetical protein
MRGASPAQSHLTAPEAAAGTDPASSGDPAQPCPSCGFPQTGRFCEGCGYDFVAGRSPAASQPAKPASGGALTGTGPGQPGSPQTASRVSETGHAAAGSLIAVVSADRDYFDAVVSDGGPDAASMTFPPYCPERTFPLASDQVRIGRRSASRGLSVEVDLTGPPLDPGVSHLHLLLIRQPDGSWQAVDPGSANGTRINDGTEPIEVNVPVPVSAGDRIHIGAWTTITLQDGARQ